MHYRPFGTTDLQLSVIGLGGHEYRPAGGVRGFSDDNKRAVQPGVIFPGFGDDTRRAIVAKALDLGINVFDLTIDSEKEALGRLLRDLQPSQDIIVQTRPEGMLYGYDPGNQKMLDYTALKNEVERICKLIGRDHVDILNFGFKSESVAATPDFLERLSANIMRLKHAGLIRFASADANQGESLMLQKIAAGCFDSLYANYNPMEQAMDDCIFPTAVQRGMGIITRNCLRKGAWFAMAEAAGISDRGAAAACAIKWCLSNSQVTSVMLGVQDAEQLEANVRILDAPALSPAQDAMIAAITATEPFKQVRAQRQAAIKR